MAPAVATLGGLTTLMCAILLLRGYSRTRRRLLLWSGLCFAGLALSNFLVYVDLVIVREFDLYPLRLGIAAAAIMLLVFGLIWDSQ
jgi:hypothetical protein